MVSNINPYPCTKDSPHFHNEARKEKQTDARIAEMRTHLARLSPRDLAGHARAVDEMVTRLEASRDLSRTWIHIDMDAFYAACECLERPELAHVPMVRRRRRLNTSG